ncbi:hypothetical protein ACQY0O_004148 [Thecaphora frezii]
MVKDLLEKRFKMENVNILLPEEKYRKVNNDIQTRKKQYTSLMELEDDLEWESSSPIGNAFFFRLGDFRFRCTKVSLGPQANKLSSLLNFKVVGYHKASRAPDLALYVGIAEIDKLAWTVAEIASRERLSALGIDLKKNGLRQIKMGDGTAENLEHPEQWQQLQELKQAFIKKFEEKRTMERKARESERKLREREKMIRERKERKQQREQATPTKRSSARKGKQPQQLEQQQQPM